MTTGAHHRVLELSKADWRLLKVARLRALKDSPDAFVSQYDAVARWRESDWASAFEAATWLVALDQGSVVGLICSARLSTEPASCHVESAWVESRYRRRGVLRSLLHRVIDLERRAGAHDLLLWVFEDNAAAQSAYARIGFVATGIRQRIGGNGPFERQFRLAIA